MRIDTIFTTRVAWLNSVSDLDGQHYNGLWSFSKHIGHSRMKTVEDMRRKEGNGWLYFGSQLGRDRWMEHIAEREAL